MTENKKKFAMPLVWHNCYDYPPEEFYNDDLIATDGYVIFPVEYQKKNGWWKKDTKRFLVLSEMKAHWWADLKQTVRGCLEFDD